MTAINISNCARRNACDDELERGLSCVQVFAKRQAGLRLRWIHDEFHKVDIDQQRSLRDSALKTRKQILRSRPEASSSSQRTTVQHRFTLFREVTLPSLASFIKKKERITTPLSLLALLSLTLIERKFVCNYDRANDNYLRESLQYRNVQYRMRYYVNIFLIISFWE